MKILIDNGHGQDTAGKRSPDGQFREYYYNRIVARRVTAKLQALGLDAELLVSEEHDVPLAERCRRVNAWCRVYGKANAICVSIHFNAFGDGSEWTSPSGWSVCTSVGNTAADSLANCIARAAAMHLPAMRIRGDWSDGDINHEAGFYILRHTLCPAVLTENGFMTNEQECRWLQTEEAIEAPGQHGDQTEQDIYRLRSGDEISLDFRCGHDHH